LTAYGAGKGLALRRNWVTGSFLSMCKLGLLPKVVRHASHRPSVRSQMPGWAGLAGLLLLLFHCSCPADSFTDGLANGYSSNQWVLYTNTSLFTVATNGGDLIFSKPAGAVNSNYQYATLASLLAARGDFSAQVDFNYNTNDAIFTFVLQNNHTSDAISAGFANFQLTADEIVPLRRQLSAQLSGPGSLVVSWEDTSWPNLLSGYTLFSSTNLEGPMLGKSW